MPLSRLAVVASLFAMFGSNHSPGQTPNVLNDGVANKTAHDKALADFKFSDRFGGCDNAESGRWYLHFRPDGSIRYGFWGENAKPPAYRFDDENATTVPLGDVFAPGAKWRRINAETLEIKSAGNRFLFSIEPNYRAADPKKSTARLTFIEQDGKGRTFEIGFYGEYQQKFESSTTIIE